MLKKQTNKKINKIKMPPDAGQIVKKPDIWSPFLMVQVISCEVACFMSPCLHLSYDFWDSPSTRLDAL